MSFSVHLDYCMEDAIAENDDIGWTKAFLYNDLIKLWPYYIENLLYA